MSLFAERTWTAPDGLALFARDYAAAPGPARLPVVCLHGLTRNSRDFEAVAPWLAARGRRVLALDMRGRGQSARDPEARYDIATYTADVIALLDGYALRRIADPGPVTDELITETILLITMALTRHKDDPTTMDDVTAPIEDFPNG